MVEKVKEATRKLIPIIIFILILIISLGIIAYGRGWRLDVTKKSVRSTGLISATSDPTGAQVYVDNVLKTATNNAFNIDPGWYTVRIIKEGYLPWEKKLRVQGEIAVKVEAFLLPGNPSLSPLTNTGVLKPTLSPDGTKVAYIIPARSGTEPVEVLKRTGLWILELSDSPLGRNRDPQQVGVADPIFASSDVSILWSPDSRQILVSAGTKSHLYAVSKAQTFTDISSTVAALTKDWQKDMVTKEKQKLAGFPQDFVSIASSSAKILSFSPDERKVLYEATASSTLPIIIKPPLIASNPTVESRDLAPGKLYVYDSKEDKNFYISSENLTVLPSVQWFPTNNHLILIQNAKIDIMEYDGANRLTVYAGPFSEKFLVPWPSGNRLVILTNLNPGASTLPNLYTVNLR